MGQHPPGGFAPPPPGGFAPPPGAFAPPPPPMYGGPGPGGQPPKSPKTGLFLALGCGTLLLVGVGAVGAGAMLWTTSASDSGPVVVSPSPAVGAASSNGTCAKTAACCRKIVEASGADPATLKNCDNFKQLPDANCTAALEGYKRSAAVLKVTCE
ncbi:MAG: hypothetical protein R3B89_00435 [Polyangiaceae bacterium]